jgi:tetratricopeptide (TPR) repeat protein
MLRKNYYTLLLAVALFLTGGLAVSAQTAPVRGKVELKKADGTTVPVADALIEVYRTDITGKFPAGKSNKKGEFSFAGFPLGARAALAVSGVGLRADVFPNIKGGDENITLTMIEGDGKAFTEAEVRQILANAPTNAPTGELTAAQKKQQEEQAKQLAKYEAEKKKVENVNAVVNKAQTEGNKAFNEKNYDLAITSYDEGINADPDFEGSAPVLLNNKSSALINRAIDKYNAALKGDPSGKAAALASAKKDLDDSLTGSARSLQILSTATNPDPNTQKRYALEKIRAYQNTIDGYSRMFSMNMDTTKGKEALTALEEFSALETDAAKKGRWQLALADGFRQAGISESAIVAYRKVLENSPDNPDALAGLGLSLFSVGAGTIPENTAQMQEGLNLMTRFAEIAPETHPLKASVKDAVDYLKTKKLEPQKTTKAGRKKT